MSSLRLYAAQGGSVAYLSQPTLPEKVSHQLSLSARTLKTIASLVTWNAWEVEMKGCRAKEEWVEREKMTLKGEGRGDRGRQHMMLMSPLRHDSSCYSALIFHMFHISHGRTDLLSCREEKGSKHWTHPPLVMEILEILDKQSQRNWKVFVGIAEN